MRFLFYQKISTDLSEAEWEVREHLISCQNKETYVRNLCNLAANLFYCPG